MKAVIDEGNKQENAKVEIYCPKCKWKPPKSCGVDELYKLSCHMTNECGYKPGGTLGALRSHFGIKIPRSETYVMPLRLPGG